MKWQVKSPTFGDIIRVKAGVFYHYGIYVNNEEIIQFGLSPVLRKTVQDSDIKVCSSNLSVFLNNEVLEVGEVDNLDGVRLPPEKTVNLAKSKLNEKGYHILYNNCEHFAYECYLGKKYCSQTDTVRQLFKAMPIVDVYVAKIPCSDNFSTIFPPIRQSEIESITNEKVKREKYYAWKLLEYGLLNTFNKKITDINFEKQNSGKWTCNVCEFSISHSNNVVCVAISKSPVGVDIEKIQPTPIDISKEILSKEELNDYNALNSDEKTTFIINAWTKKESLFKQKNVKHLSRVEFRNLTGLVSLKTINIDNDIYSLSIATDAPDKIRIYEGINL